MLFVIKWSCQGCLLGLTRPTVISCLILLLVWTREWNIARVNCWLWDLLNLAKHIPSLPVFESSNTLESMSVTFSFTNVCSLAVYQQSFNTHNIYIIHHIYSMPIYIHHIYNKQYTHIYTFQCIECNIIYIGSNFWCLTDRIWILKVCRMQMDH